MLEETLEECKKEREKEANCCEQMGRRLGFVCVGLLLVVMADVSNGDLLEDEKECADELANMASCIPFVSGAAKKPTKQCCDDTVKVRASKPKCLCVLIKESTDPAMALPVNTTLALQMPSACNIDAKISDCPSILKLSPDSPDAKIFKEAGGNSTTSTASPPSASHANSTSPAGNKTSPSSSEGRMERFGGRNMLWLVLSVAWMLG